MDKQVTSNHPPPIPDSGYVNLHYWPPVDWEPAINVDMVNTLYMRAEKALMRLALAFHARKYKYRNQVLTLLHIDLKYLTFHNIHWQHRSESDRWTEK